jgi:HD superfamily phosphodiesterase
MNPITLNDIISDKKLSTYLLAGNDHLAAMGFTEHGTRHAKLVSKIAARILTDLGYSKREAELAAIAGYLHDIGNVVSRHNHGQTASMIVMRSVEEMGMDYSEIGLVVSAIGNHEEQYGHAVNSVAAALILADKSDVHRSRVRNRDVATFDIHDRVNYAANKSEVVVDSEERVISLRLTIDTEICPVMDYFEIFLTRMVMCRRAAEHLKSKFSIYINDAKLL